MTRCLLALLLITGAAPVAHAADPLQVLDACIRRLDPSLDVGFARIRQRCPELQPALAASPYAPWLPADWDTPENALSVGGLSELWMMLSRVPARRAVRAPELAHLKAVLAQLAPPAQTHLSWWGRLKAWLKRLYAPAPEESGDSWFERLLGGFTLSDAVRRVIVWCSVAFVLALAALIIANELRAAGLLRSAARRRPRADAAGGGTAVADLAALEHLAAHEQPPRLLALIAGQLTLQHRLPPSRALTVHELERAAELNDPEDQARLLALTAACERTRFAPEPLPAPLLAQALARGRELLARLSAGRPAAAGTP
jgi:hypothetical protein